MPCLSQAVALSAPVLVFGSVKGGGIGSRLPVSGTFDEVAEFEGFCLGDNGREKGYGCYSHGILLVLFTGLRRGGV